MNDLKLVCMISCQRASNCNLLYVCNNLGYSSNDLKYKKALEGIPQGLRVLIRVFV